LVATVDTLGQQMPSSLAASASTIRISFGVGESCCRQAQFIAAILTAPPVPPPPWSGARGAWVSNAA